jgi:hypothetical protein
MRVQNQAYGNFRDFMCDIVDLISFHDTVQSRRKTTGGGMFRKGRNPEVLRRATIIMLVTAWETFIEDFLRIEFQKRSDASMTEAHVNQFNSEVATLNNPTSQKIIRLFNKFLAFTDITTAWILPNATPAEVRKKLDDLVILRGDLVHRGEKYHSRRKVSPEEMRAAKELVEGLAKLTASAFGVMEWEPHTTNNPSD